VVNEPHWLVAAAAVVVNLRWKVQPRYSSW
jgi:hypothetical protein